MLAIRYFSVVFLASVAIANSWGQVPLTDPSAVELKPSGLVNAGEPEWTPPSEVIVSDPILHGEVLESTELVEAPAPCGCGQNPCPGVCRDPGHPAKPKIKKPGDRNRGDCPPYRYRISDEKRAGSPRSVAPWAACSVNSKYSAWFVGGGSPFRRGRCRKPSEGTWGLDYGGFFGHAKVWLNYTRGRKQGGEGAYETDGEPEFVSKAHEIMGVGH